MEFYALYFPLGAVLPQIVSDGPEGEKKSLLWNNQAVVGYIEEIDLERWTKSQTHVCCINGKVKRNACAESVGIISFSSFFPSSHY